MKNEAYLVKSNKKIKNYPFFLYNILDNLTKNLLKLKNYFRNNPLLYISFKLLFSIIFIILPLFIVANDSLLYLRSENQVEKLEKTFAKKTEKENNFPSFNNKTLIRNNNNESSIKKIKIIHKKRNSKNKNTTDITEKNHKENSEVFINKNKIFEKFKKEFLKVELLKDGNNFLNDYEKDKKIDLFFPLKLSISILIIILLSYLVNKIYHFYSINL